MAFLLYDWEMCANRYLKEFNRTWIWLPPPQKTNFLYSFAALLKSPETGGVAQPHSLGLDLISCLIQSSVSS
ncbi:hypothetical protein K1719_034060 [Acacia pycnantha]|nr:hypothetical protein K1719_034060 [Acacia pycnantha]